jgi:hypothetical protein
MSTSERSDVPTTKLRTWTEDEPRFRELLLYVCQKCANDLKFGATKLNKILYFSDFRAYAQFGKPITGFQYQRERNGPVPKHLMRVQAAMIASGELAMQPIRLASGHVQKRLVNLREPNLDVFTASEMSLVDSIIDGLRDSTAEEVSELSHRMAGWKIADPGEIIPYETVFVSADALTDADIQRAIELAKTRSEHGRG